MLRSASRAAGRTVAVLLCGWQLHGEAHAATPSVQAAYMLGCQGCHLEDGRGFPQRGVPALNEFVGNFLKVPGGREYLVQVPGAAQSERAPG
jgi:cytochrome c553